MGSIGCNAIKNHALKPAIDEKLCFGVTVNHEKLLKKLLNHHSECNFRSPYTSIEGPYSPNPDTVISDMNCVVSFIQNTYCWTITVTSIYISSTSDC